MSSITTSLFLEFAIIFPFILHACTAETKTPRMDAIIQIKPSSKFRAECEKSIGAGKNRDLGGTSWDSISQECMMYCAFRKIGMMDAHADLHKDYVESHLKYHKRHGKSSKKVYESIRRCSTGSDRHHVCVKAMRNAYCMFDYLGDEWVEDDMANVMRSW